MAVNYKLITEAPSDQNILDLFAGEWSTGMPSSSGLVTQPGASPLMDDPRIHWLRQEMGSLEGLDILELGPLEGAHSYMLQQAGARSVTAIEANNRAFLKCLSIKEIFGLDRVSFKLGNFFPYLENCRQFDVIVASGVLYHMVEPLKLLDLIIAKSDNILIWTHYYDRDALKDRPDFPIYEPARQLGSGPYMGSRRLYPEAALSWSGFSGGADSYAVWLTRDSLLKYFENHGFSVTINFEQVDHVNGPSLALCAKRKAPYAGI